jgi:hypothetical protein
MVNTRAKAATFMNELKIPKREMIKKTALHAFFLYL